MNKELEKQCKRVEELDRCIHKKNGYCEKIKHSIVSGVAILCHCNNCKLFAKQKGESHGN